MVGYDEVQGPDGMRPHYRSLIERLDGLGLSDGLRGETVTFLAPSPHVRWNGEIEGMAREAVAGEETALGAISAISRRAHQSLEYRPGAAFVGVELAQVVSEGKGVCQDFAHLAVALARAVGIPARYHPGGRRDPAGENGRDDTA